MLLPMYARCYYLRRIKNQKTTTHMLNYSKQKLQDLKKKNRSEI